MNSDYSRSMERKRRGQLRGQTKRALQQLRDYTRQNNMELMVAIAPPAFVIHPERFDATFDTGGPRSESGRC